MTEIAHLLLFWPEPPFSSRLGLALLILVLPAHGVLWRRTGHSPLWALFMFLPVTGLAAVYVLAFKSWPILDRTRRGR